MTNNTFEEKAKNSFCTIGLLFRKTDWINADVIKEYAAYKGVTVSSLAKMALVEKMKRDKQEEVYN